MSTDGARGPRWIPALLLGAGLAVGAVALHAGLSRRVPLAFVHGARFHATVLALAVLLLLGGLALVREVRGARADAATPSAPLLRWAWIAAVATWLGFLLVGQPFQRLHLVLALGLGASGFAAGTLAVRSLQRRAPRTLRILELIAFSLATATVGLELGLRAWATLRPTPLLARVQPAPATRIARFRCAPGELRFGFPCNSQGYYDGEFTAREESDPRPLVAVVGDSFSVGAVPHAFHYTTVAETLWGARIDSFGVAGIGPPEYAHLVTEEVLPLAPDAIVIALFVGNDLDVEDPLETLTDPGLRSWFQRDQVLLPLVLERLGRERRERRRGGILEVQGEAGAALEGDAAAVAREFPWVLDPTLEEPTLDDEVFLELETRRALTLCAADPPGLPVVWRSLEEARRAAGDVPLRVLLIPDEFQVDDGLWETVQARAGVPLERDRPQRLLAAGLAARGFEFVDLLPLLRAEPPAADGRPHLYHRNDTHFNARGNRVAADGLGQLLRRD
jgi:hypothetical protein